MHSGGREKSGLPGFPGVDQAVGGAVVAGDSLVGAQLRQDLVGQLFAQLHAPLVEAEDVPDCALYEDFVLVHGDQGTQGFRGQALEQDAVGRAVAFEHLEWHQMLDLLQRLAGGQEFGLHGFLALAEGQGLGLGEEVGQQFRMVITDGVVADGWCQEVTGDHLGALVDQLVEGVLAVGARLTPDDGTGLVVDLVAVAVHVFAVGLHVALLEVGGETVHVLVVRQNGFGLGTMEVVVPQANQRQQHRHVLLIGGCGEVHVHLEGALQQGFEVLETDRQGDRHADGGPGGVTAADPVPELKHVGGVDTELGHGLTVGGEGCEVLGNVGLVTGMPQEPVAGAQCVGHGLLSGEGLGGHQEQGGFRIDLLQGLGDVGAVDVGDKVHLQVILVGAQGFGDHDGTEIGTADADVDHMLDRLAGVTFPLAGDDLLAEALHLGQYGVHFRHHVLAVHLDRAVGAVAQGHVQHGAPFGHVDLLAVEHGVDGAAQIGLFGQINQ